MTFPQGIYFRATDNQTDPTDCDASVSISSADYPVTSAQGNTVGWEDTSSGSRNSRDRDVATDVKLKGLHFAPQALVGTFRIDLPATGNYKFRAALGDDSSEHNCRIQVLDTSTVKIDSDPGTVPTGNFSDIAGTIHTTSALWTSNNALSASQSFSTTICRFKIGNSSGGSADPNTVVAFVYVESAGGGGGIPAKSFGFILG